MILSLDVSSKCTGWAIYDMEGLLVDYGSFRPASLLDFLDNISKLLLRGISNVVCEQIFCGINKNTFKRLVIPLCKIINYSTFIFVLHYDNFSSSASTIILTSSANFTFGSNPNTSLLFVASPNNKSTSAGLIKLGSNST